MNKDEMVVYVSVTARLIAVLNPIFLPLGIKPTLLWLNGKSCYALINFLSFPVILLCLTYQN